MVDYHLQTRKVSLLEGFHPWAKAPARDGTTCPFSVLEEIRMQNSRSERILGLLYFLVSMGFDSQLVLGLD